MLDKDLMFEFLTLGEDCEFSFIQRRLGAEPLELFRLAATNRPGLIKAFNEDFVAMGDPECTSVVAEGPTVWCRNSAYDFQTHLLEHPEKLDDPAFIAKQCTRLRFLRRKFLEDLADSRKILVYKRRGELTFDRVYPILEAARRFGPQTLLWVVTHDEEHPVGSVERVADGFLKGYIDEFTAYGRAAFGSLDVWLQICRNAYAINAACRASVADAQNAGSGKVFFTAKFQTSLKKRAVAASELADDEKVIVRAGEVVAARTCEAEGSHARLEHIELNSKPLDAAWFLYKDHWAMN